MPISEPSNADALSGTQAPFDFGAFEANTADFSVTLHDGSTKNLTVPVLIDKETGETILADAKREAAAYVKVLDQCDETTFVYPKMTEGQKTE